MTFKHLLVSAALFAATGAAMAQQAEFIQPDAAFRPTLTRAEVRQQVSDGYARKELAPAQRDGQDVRYARGEKSRAEVKAEARNVGQSRQAVGGLYFG